MRTTGIAIALMVLLTAPLMLLSTPGTVLAKSSSPEAGVLESATPCPSVCARADSKDKARAVEEIFGQSVPAEWSAMCGGPITRLKDKGVFLLMSNAQRKTMAIVVKVQDLAKSDPLLDENRARLAHHLFDSYIFARDGFQATETGRTHFRAGKLDVASSRLIVRFSDGFVEPDLIGVVEKLPDKKNERLIIMLGQPEAGGIESRSEFFVNFRTMEGLMKRMLED